MSEPAVPQPAPIDAPLDGPMSDAELQALLVQARASDDARLRRLVTSYVTLRRVTADVVAFIAAREGGAAIAESPLLLRARQLAATANR